MWNTTVYGIEGVGSTRAGWITVSPLGGLPSPYPGTTPETTTSNATTNETDIEKYLESYLGARHRSLPESVILTIVYCAIFITGVIGNVSTCIVIAKNNYMHTATNYYLFSLAISDVMTLIIGLPPELYTIQKAYPWIFGEPFCVFKTFVSEMTSSASVLTITAFTVERYVAICHPIRAQTMSSLSRAVKIIIAIWTISCATALPYPIHTSTYFYLNHPDHPELPLKDSQICNITRKYILAMKYMFQFTTFILFIAPMSIISVLYIMIGITLRKSGVTRRSSGSSSSQSPTGPNQSRKTVLKMLVAVVVAFFICWAPFHAQRLMTAFIPDSDWTETLLEIQSVLFYISGVLYFISSTVNPILYNLMSRKYRQAFKETLCRCVLTAEERRHFRDGRGRIYSERSATYFTAAASGGNQYTTKLLSEKSDSSNNKGSVSPSRVSNTIPEQQNGCQRTWASMKARIFSRHKDSEKRGKRPNGFKNGTQRTANGSVCAESKQSACSTSQVAQHLREELEMTDVVPPAIELSEHDVILPKEAKDKSPTGTFL